MIAATLSAIFIRDFSLPNIAGYTPIHLLIVYTLFNLYRGFSALAQHNVTTHRKTMQRTYLFACVVAGAFTLLPTRYLGRLVWGDWMRLL